MSDEWKTAIIHTMAASMPLHPQPGDNVTVAHRSPVEVDNDCY